MSESDSDESGDESVDWQRCAIEAFESDTSMSGGEVSDGRLWWAAEAEFELNSLGKYKFGEWMDGTTVAVVKGLSFSFQLQLFPKGNKYRKDEVRDRMGVGIALVDGPGDELADFKFNVKVHKADGSLKLKTATGKPVTMNEGHGWFSIKALPMAVDKLAPYVLGEEGSQFVKVRVEFGIPPAAFDALSYLPAPALRSDLPDRFRTWCHSGNGTVTVVAGDGGRPFIVYRDVLTEASDVFKNMLDTAMTEGGSGCIEIKDLCTEALDELISFITSGATRLSRLHAHVLKLLDASQRYMLADLKRLCERTVVEKMQEKKLKEDFLDLLQTAETYELRVALNVGLCRLLKAYHQLSDQEKARFKSSEFGDLRGLYMNLTSQAHCAVKC